MGKFQSKLGSKRRQSPEGGSLTSNVLNCQQEPEQIHIHKLTENLYLELRGGKSDSSRDRKGALPPKKRSDKSHSIHLQVQKQTKKRGSHAGATECNMEPDEDAQQEWVFTLYNQDNKKGKSSLIRSIYEVLEASVKQPCNATFPLRIKLVMMPSTHTEKTSQSAAEKKESVFQEAPVRGLFCVDENKERRNHYMDLAGIENYASKFEDTESPFVTSKQKAHYAPRHYPVVISENCTTSDSPRGVSSPGLLRSKTMSPAAQRTHSKRLRSKVQDAAYNPYFSCEALKHEHHHQHEHHHHHHHHHQYRPS
ncbi:leucine-rich repeat-containing protein 14B isoform X2 [Notolabrus celidotus]|uniref:leucine-rich repeat-containing protein 14B isoform X2 n=1 Tax=Notolabrus celidotus TaxID=1203425 RepID=UPI00148F823B|nr:leucine-rich repeat-containing protein 14B isoform X2 [Notolabrus celidotus]